MPHDTTMTDPPREIAHPGGSSSEIGRQAFLERRATVLGQAWSRRCRGDLHREGRHVAGGWPGTMREARSEVARTMVVEMAGWKMPAITEAEMEAAARTANASARLDWRRHASPDVA